MIYNSDMHGKYIINGNNRELELLLCNMPEKVHANKLSSKFHSMSSKFYLKEKAFYHFQQHTTKSLHHFQ